MDPNTTKYEQARIRVNEYGARLIRELLKAEHDVLTEMRQREGWDDASTFKRLMAVERIQNELNRTFREHGWDG